MSWFKEKYDGLRDQEKHVDGFFNPTSWRS